MLETPSRIWRRIEAVEAETGDMPSLPSLPGFDDSAAEDVDPSLSRARSVSLSLSHNSVSLPPVQSTPAISFATTRSTIRPQSSTSSTVRFANSIHTNRSGKSTFSGSGSGSREKTVRSALDESFNVPEISYHYEEDGDAEQEMVIDSGSGFPDVHFSTHHISQEELEGEGEQELSLTEALESISRTSSPRPDVHEIDNGTMRTPAQFKTYDYSVSLRAENVRSPLIVTLIVFTFWSHLVIYGARFQPCLAASGHLWKPYTVPFADKPVFIFGIIQLHAP